MFNNFSPFPTLHTERLHLRQLIATDEAEIFVHRSDPRLLEFVDFPPAKTLEDAQQFIQKINLGIAANTGIYWAITLKDSPILIGTICLFNFSAEQSMAELGYMLHSDFQGKGYMCEALASVVVYSFQVMKVNLIEAEVHLKNIASIRLLERNQFVRVGEENGCAVFRRGSGID